MTMNESEFGAGVQDAKDMAASSSARELKRYYRDARDSATRMRSRNGFGARAYFLGYAWAIR